MLTLLGRVKFLEQLSSPQLFVTSEVFPDRQDVRFRLTIERRMICLRDQQPVQVSEASKLADIWRGAADKGTTGIANKFLETWPHLSLPLLDQLVGLLLLVRPC